MYPRVEYEMTKEDLNEILEAIKPIPMIMLQIGSPPSQQERANSAWDRLGKKMGFDYMTVQPSNKGNRFFTAVPSETDSQKSERIARENENMRQEQIKKLKEEIAEKQKALDLLTEDI